MSYKKQCYSEFYSFYCNMQCSCFHSMTGSDLFSSVWFNLSGASEIKISLASALHQSKNKTTEHKHFFWWTISPILVTHSFLDLNFRWARMYWTGCIIEMIQYLTNSDISSKCYLLNIFELSTKKYLSLLPSYLRSTTW